MGIICNDVIHLEREGQDLAFHIPTSALFALEAAPATLLQMASVNGDSTAEELKHAIIGRGYTEQQFDSAFTELSGLGLIIRSEDKHLPSRRLVDLPPKRKGFSTLVAHVAHTCNLKCSYCYADAGLYGGKAQLMSGETGDQYVDWLFDNSSAPSLALTFFGGEPLLNWDVVKRMAHRALNRAQSEDRDIRFSMTTNGTLMTPAIAEQLVAWGVHVTISLDGNKATNDRQRIDHDGRGTYQRVIAHLEPLLTAGRAVVRATLTRDDVDVVNIVEHLMELGFRSVGISPVDTGDGQFDLAPEDYPVLLDGFTELAHRYRDEAREGRRFGFQNIEGLLNAFHSGHNKDHPCGAGIQMLAGGPNGDLHLCHRFMGDTSMKLGTIQTGVPEPEHQSRLQGLSLDNRAQCGSCWARYICGGGCHHANKVHTGDPRVTKKIHCDWLRAWYRVGLEVYADLALARPQHFTDVLGSEPTCVEDP